MPKSSCQRPVLGKREPLVSALSGVVQNASGVAKREAVAAITFRPIIENSEVVLIKVPVAAQSDQSRSLPSC